MSALLNNRYKILQTLGSGGCGHTFLAEDTYMPSNRKCVVKQLKPITSDATVYQIIKERFQREAAILEKLGQSCDQIPSLHAYFTEGGEFYLVQDWIEGKTLSKRVRDEGTYNENEAKELLIRVLSVLDYVHSQGIIHRDIKPDNIMLRSDNKPVLIDFGAVKEVVTTIIDSSGMTNSSIVIGTPGFMPYEQAAGKPVFASDIYSLGVTADYLLKGKYPWELADLHLSNISDNFRRALQKSTEVNPSDRYQNAREMLQALQALDNAQKEALPSTVLISKIIKESLPRYEQTASLTFIRDFLSPFLGTSLKERLFEPKASSDIAKERAFTLYKTLDEVSEKTEDFIGELEGVIELLEGETFIHKLCRSMLKKHKPMLYISVLKHKPSEQTIDTRLKSIRESIRELMMSLNRLVKDLAAMNPQLDIHKHALVHGIEAYGAVRSRIIAQTEYSLERLSTTSKSALRQLLAEAKGNRELIRKAVEEFRIFLAQEFSFKESF